MGRSGPVCTEVGSLQHSTTVHFDWNVRHALGSRYNVAPRSQAPVISRPTAARNASGSSSGESRPSSDPMPVEGDREKDVTSKSTDAHEQESTTEPVRVVMQTMRWGLVPHFSKHEDPSLKTINARCEALIEEPRGMWASIKGKKRCAVVCQGCVYPGAVWDAGLTRFTDITSG